MAPPISLLLGRHKLNASFDGTTVTHITRESNLEARQRLVQVTTVWKTEDRIGAGAFGVVWRQKADTGKLRAVKVIARDKLNLQELEALIGLQDHPELFITFSGWFENIDRDTIHIAMEYIEHGDLGKYIAEFGTKVEAREITSQILEGLDILHKREICHRDLKPQNILVASLAPIWIKISDFGISKHWAGTTLKTRCGTAIYSSPEQIGFLPPKYRRSEHSYTHNIDIWALGVIVHEMLTLEIPFRETYTLPYSDLTLSVAATGEQAVDMAQLYEYCKGAIEFPCDSLQRASVSADGINFVKSLLVVDPARRASAAVSLASRWIQSCSVSQLGKPEVRTTAGPSRSTGSSDMAMEEEAHHREMEHANDKVAEVFDRERRGGEPKSIPKQEKRSEQHQRSWINDSANMKIDSVRANMTKPGYKSSKTQHYSSNQQAGFSFNNRDDYSSNNQVSSNNRVSSKRVSSSDRSSSSNRDSSNNRDPFNNGDGYNRKTPFSISTNKPSSSHTTASGRVHSQEPSSARKSSTVSGRVHSQESSSARKSSTKATAEAPVPALDWGAIFGSVDVPSSDNAPCKEVEKPYTYVATMAAADTTLPVLEEDAEMGKDIPMDDCKMEDYVPVYRETEASYATRERGVTVIHGHVPKLSENRTVTRNRSIDNLSGNAKEPTYGSKVRPETLSNKEQTRRRSYQPIYKVQRRDQLEAQPTEPNTSNSSRVTDSRVTDSRVSESRVSESRGSESRVSEPDPINHNSMEADVPEPEQKDPWAQASVPKSLKYSSSTEAVVSQSVPEEFNNEWLEQCVVDAMYRGPIPTKVVSAPELVKSSFHQVYRSIPTAVEPVESEREGSVKKTAWSPSRRRAVHPVPMEVDVLQPSAGKPKGKSSSTRQSQWELGKPAQPVWEERSATAPRPVDEMVPSLAEIRGFLSIKTPAEVSAFPPIDTPVEEFVLSCDPEQDIVTETGGRAQPAPVVAYPTTQERRDDPVMQDVLAIEPTSPALSSPSRPPDGSNSKGNSKGKSIGYEKTHVFCALQPPEGWTSPSRPRPSTQGRSGSIDTQTVLAMAPTSGVFTSTPGPQDYQPHNTTARQKLASYTPVGAPSIAAQNPYETHTRSGDTEIRRADQGSHDAHVPPQYPQDPFSGVKSNKYASPAPGTGRGQDQVSGKIRAGEYHQVSGKIPAGEYHQVSGKIPAGEYQQVSGKIPAGEYHLESGYPIGHPNHRPQDTLYEQGHKAQPPSRQNSYPYGGHHQQDHGQVVSVAVIPVVRSHNASGTFPLPSPTRSTDNESQPRWRQWVDDMKESLNKTGRK